MKRSLYLRLFCTFFAVLFVSLAIITTTFVYFRQKAENEQQVENMLHEARSFARSANEFFITQTIKQASYNRLINEYIDEKTDMWIVMKFIGPIGQAGMLFTMQNVNPIYSAPTLDDVEGTLITIAIEGKEISTLGAFNYFYGKRMYTVGAPILDITGKPIGAIYIHKEYDPITLDMLGNMLFEIAGITLLLSALPMLFIVNSVTRPLKEMSAVSQKFAVGDFKSRVENYKVREIDMLAGSLNKMAEDLAKLDQLRIGFVANVSHELRSPLTSMHGYLQGMLDDTISPAEREKYLGVVAEETKRLMRLVEDLLNLSRIESGNMPTNKSKFDICELLRRVLIKFEARIEEKRLGVEVIFRPEQCFVFADQDRIEQVVSNLVDNAVKFLPEEGTLSLYTSKGVDDVYIGVKDSGIGISQDDQAFIFERFYKVDKAHTSGTGTGLGLSIAHKIIELHGHELGCKSKPGEGSEFHFKLDLCKEK